MALIVPLLWTLLWASTAAKDVSFSVSSPDEAVSTAEKWRDLLAGHLGARSAGGGGQTDLEKEFVAWQAWVAQTGVLDDAQYTGNARFRLWARSLARAVRTNLHPNTTKYERLTPFSSLTPRERRWLLGERFNASYLQPYDAGQQHRKPISRSVEDQLPKLVDWRVSGHVTPVKRQGMCGACYAFAVAAAVESWTLIANNRTVADYPLSLSEQQVISCGNEGYRPGFGGCSGGHSFRVLQYISSSGGLVTSAHYPYEAQKACVDRVCQTFTCERGRVVPFQRRNETWGANPFPGYRTITPYSKAALMEAVAQGPVVFAFRVVPDFWQVGAGVYDTDIPSCLNPGPSGFIRTNHAAIIVGYDVTGPIPYWIVKNSWGTDVGDQGYWKMKMYPDGLGLCGMYQAIQQPLVPPRDDLPPLA